MRPKRPGPARSVLVKTHELFRGPVSGSGHSTARGVAAVPNALPAPRRRVGGMLLRRRKSAQVDM
jgi:hypothetical protein